MKTLLKVSLALGVALTVADYSNSAPAEEKSGWTVLFDGTSTAAFRGFKQNSFPSASWIIESDGSLESVPTKPIDLITREKYENFELELEWKVAKQSNSGIMFHVSEEDP